MVNRRDLMIGLPLLLAGCKPEPYFAPSAGVGPYDPFPFWANRPDRQSSTIRGRQEVDFSQAFEPGTVVVDTAGRYLFHVLGNGRAARYPIGVGKEGLTFEGYAVVGRKAEWPAWYPTADMIRRDPERYRPHLAGIPGGPESPLGARALYLYRDGKDTLFRIHGTNQPETVGTASSSGCIRMLNEDVIDLYSRVPIGAPVVVLQV
ncbi:L,D-transpeptidase [Mesorhizobium sp. ANAO-SY3R2]|uniref:L,D-transpeptidase n=1 Tax=Mesorhizobium sp. ANAO-SY3R2 TaxID=3166644 RepID=UPI00367151E9